MPLHAFHEEYFVESDSCKTFLIHTNGGGVYISDSFFRKGVPVYMLWFDLVIFG